MGSFHGKDGAVDVDGTAVGRITQFQVDQSADVADDTVMGDEWKTNLVGQKSWSGSLTCKLDKAIDAGQLLLVVGATVLLNLKPDGVKIMAGTAIITGRGTPINKDSGVELSINFTGSGALTDGMLVV